MCLIVSAFSKLKCGTSPSTGSPAACNGSLSNSFSVTLRQHTKLILPLGRSILRILENARKGSSKNITPNRENMRSKLPDGIERVSAFSRNNVTCGRCCVRDRATSRTSGAFSTPMTRPSLPTRSINWSMVSPAPHPTSKMVCPRPASSASMATMPRGDICRSIKSANSARALSPELPVAVGLPMRKLWRKSTSMAMSATGRSLPFEFVHGPWVYPASIPLAKICATSAAWRAHCCASGRGSRNVTLRFHSASAMLM